MLRFLSKIKFLMFFLPNLGVFSFNSFRLASSVDNSKVELISSVFLVVLSLRYNFDLVYGLIFVRSVS